MKDNHNKIYNSKISFQYKNHTPKTPNSLIVFIPLPSQFFLHFGKSLQERKSVSGFYIVQKIFGCVGAHSV